MPAEGRTGSAAWGRFWLVQGLQLLPTAIAWFGTGATVLWLAGLLGSAICAAGTDSGWRWRNRLLVLQAVAWLLLPLLGATPELLAQVSHSTRWASATTHGVAARSWPATSCSATASLPPGAQGLPTLRPMCSVR